jgi:tetratricopeptide (TPR) repeat protein
LASPGPKKYANLPATSLLISTEHLSSLQLSSTPPPAPEIFFGRDKFVTDAVSLLETTKSARLVILGAGGMGKTATALTILHDERVQDTFQNHRYFVSCEAAITSSLLVQSVLHVLGAKVPEKEDLLTTLHKCLVSSGPMVLVLDNFETPWDIPGLQPEVQDILCRIATVKNVSLIVTMRGNTSPYGIKWSWTDKLSMLVQLEPEAARLAYLAVDPDAGDGRSDNDLRSLLHEMDYVPLAIMLMANIGKGEDVKYLLKRYREERTSLLQTQGSKSGRLNSVDASISVSLKSSAMTENPEAVQLLGVLCHLPDGLYSWRERLQSLITEFTLPHQLVSVLLRAALAYDDSGTLKVLSPIRDYIVVYHQPETRHMLHMEQYYIDLISTYATKSFGKELAISRVTLEPELGNITYILKNAIKTNPKESVVEAVYQLSWFSYRTIPSADLLHFVIPYMDNCGMADKLPQFQWLIAEILRFQAKYPEAREMLLEAQKQFNEIGNQHGAAQCLQSLGNILRVQAKYPEAREMLLEAQMQFTKIGSELRVAQCLQSLGNILRVQVKYAEARETLLEAQKQFTEIGDQLGVAQCLHRLGDILRMQAKYPEATEMLLEAQEQFTEIGNKLGAAQCLRSLGGILGMEDKYPEAREMLLEAHRQFNEIGHQLGAAQCLQSLGNILRVQAKYPEAKEMLLEAQKQFTEIGDPLGVAQCLQSLGNILRMEDKYPEARDVAKGTEEVL